MAVYGGNCRGTTFVLLHIAKVRLLRNNVLLMAGHLMKISVSNGMQLREQSFGLWEGGVVAEVTIGDSNLVVKQFELLLWKRKSQK